MWMCNKGRLCKEDQQYGEWLRVDLVRAIRKTMATIPGAARSKVPWQRQSNVHSKVSHEVGEKSNHSASASAHKESWEKEDRRAVLVVMNGNASGMVNVFQQGSEGNVSDLTGLRKEWVRTIEV